MNSRPKCNHVGLPRAGNPIHPIPTLLRDKRMKMTAPRKAILHALTQSDHPLTPRDIQTAAGLGQCDLATVYRLLHTLERHGLVKRFDFGDGSARYEWVCERDSHHHHLVCTSCSAVVEIEECFPEELQSRIAATNGFSEVTHRLEFFGRCPKCRE